MRTIAKTRSSLFQFTVTLDIDIERAVGQYVRDLIVGEERFERTEPDHVVAEIGGKGYFLSLLSWTRSSVAISLTRFAISTRKMARGMRPATVGSIRDITAVRIRSLNVPGKARSAPGGEDSSVRSGTRTRPGRRSSGRRGPKPVELIRSVSTMAFARALAPKFLPPEPKPPR